MIASSALTTPHRDFINDCQEDDIGRFRATCSSDGTIVIHPLGDNTNTACQTLFGHDGPVWSIAWAPIALISRELFLVSGGYDGRVILWKNSIPETGLGAFEKCDTEILSAAVNRVAWCPAEAGWRLACALVDGTIRESICENNKWGIFALVGKHDASVRSVAWCPVVPRAQEVPCPVLCSGGMDACLMLWQTTGITGNYRNYCNRGEWLCLIKLPLESPIHDIGCAPRGAYEQSILAVATQQKSVRIYHINLEDISIADEKEKNFLEQLATLPLESVPCAVSWCPFQNAYMIAVSLDNGSVAVYCGTEDFTKLHFPGASIVKRLPTMWTETSTALLEDL